MLQNYDAIQYFDSSIWFVDSNVKAIEAKINKEDSCTTCHSVPEAFLSTDLAQILVCYREWNLESIAPSDHMGADHFGHFLNHFGQTWFFEENSEFMQ